MNDYLTDGGASLSMLPVTLNMRICEYANMRICEYAVMDSLERLPLCCSRCADDADDADERIEGQ